MDYRKYLKATDLLLNLEKTMLFSIEGAESDGYGAAITLYAEVIRVIRKDLYDATVDIIEDWEGTGEP